MTRLDASRGVLALIRHAESTWVAEGRFQGRSDPPLSRLGVLQASLLADRLSHRAMSPETPLLRGVPVAIHHSPLERAAGTARVIAARFGDRVPLTADSLLIEIGQGDWEGLSHPEVTSRWPVELAAWRRDPWSANAPGGESLAEADDRVRAALEGILDPLKEGSRDGSRTNEPPWAMVISHDGVLRLALMRLLGIARHLFWSFPFPLAGITIIEAGETPGAPGQLLAHGLIGHLRRGPGDATSLVGSARERDGAL